MVARHGWSFLHDAVWQQNVGRYATATYGHHASVFSLVLPALAGLLPWTAALPGAIGRLRWRNGTRREVLRTCMLASAATALAFYSLSNSKLPSYALVCVPPLAIMIGLLLDEDFDSRGPMARTAHRTALLLGLCAAVLVAAPFGASHFLTVRQLLGGIRPVTTDVGALLAPVTIPLGCLAAVAALVVVLTNSPRGRVCAIATVGALAPILIVAVARPVLTAMYPWEVFGKAIAARPAPVWLLGRRAPSLTFYAGRPIFSSVNLDLLGTEIAREHAGWLAMTRDDWAQFADAEPLRTKEHTLVAERGRMVLVWFADLPLARGTHGDDLPRLVPRGSRGR